MRKEHPPEKGDIKAFLGPGSEFEGKLSFHEIVRIDGTFRGEIVSGDTLIVGDAADLQGDVTVGTLILSGRFKGTIKASDKVDLRAPARVEGSVETAKLIVQEGVVFNGSLVMPEGAQGKEKGK